MPEPQQEIAFGIELFDYDRASIVGWTARDLIDDFGSRLPTLLDLAVDKVDVSFSGIRRGRARGLKRPDFERELGAGSDPFSLFVKFAAERRSDFVQETFFQANDRSLLIRTTLRLEATDRPRWDDLISSLDELARKLASIGRGQGVLLSGPAGSGQAARFATEPGVSDEYGFQLLRVYEDETPTPAVEVSGSPQHVAAVPQISGSEPEVPPPGLIAAIEAQDSELRIARRLPPPVLYGANFAEADVSMRAEELRRKCDMTGYWTFMVDGSDYDEEMPELLWESNSELGPRAVLAASEIDVDRLLVRDSSKAAALKPRESRRYNAREPMFVSLFGEIEPLEDLPFVPAQSGWEALAQLGFEGGNSSFSTAEHAAVAKWLLARAGGVPILVGVDRIMYCFPAMNRSDELTHLLAVALMQYCPDLEQAIDEERLSMELGKGAAGHLGLWWD